MNVSAMIVPIILTVSVAYSAQSGEISNPAPDKPSAEKTWIWALEKTYEQRCLESALAQRLNHTSLVLPYPNILNLSPMIKEKGSLPLKARSDTDISKFIWKTAPFKEAHREYLALRGGMIDAKKDRELIDWCEKKGIPECAELEYRRLLMEFNEEFQQAAYQAINQKWLVYADKNQSSLCLPLPLEGEWYVVPDKNGHHRMKASAAYAFDMVIHKNGTPFKKNASLLENYYNKSPSALENYYAWAQPVLAQADGIVTYVTNDFPDMAPGQAGAFGTANSIAIDYGGGISVFFAHLKKGSSKVKVGDRVKAGQVVGLVGNSGASGAPHLHFTLLDTMFSIKGRFRFEVMNGNKWDKIDGKNLKEGTCVRNLVSVFNSKENAESAKVREP